MNSLRQEDLASTRTLQQQKFKNASYFNTIVLQVTKEKIQAYTQHRELLVTKYKHKKQICYTCF